MQQQTNQAIWAPLMQMVSDLVWVWLQVASTNLVIKIKAIRSKNLGLGDVASVLRNKTEMADPYEIASRKFFSS